MLFSVLGFRGCRTAYPFQDFCSFYVVCFWRSFFCFWQPTATEPFLLVDCFLMQIYFMLQVFSKFFVTSSIYNKLFGCTSSISHVYANILIFKCDVMVLHQKVIFVVCIFFKFHIKAVLERIVKVVASCFLGIEL